MSKRRDQTNYSKGLTVSWALFFLGIIIAVPMLASTAGFAKGGRSYTVVDTGQTTFFDNHTAIPRPKFGKAFYGQDAQYTINAPSYRDNGDGTVTDRNTGLMWQKGYVGGVTWSEATAKAKTFSLAGYNDWRMPSIKELYSLVQFSGRDPNIRMGSRQRLTPFIDTDYFDFEYGDVNSGRRIIDAQYWSSTRYVSTTMNGNPTAFGLNIADGRIKGYPTSGHHGRRSERFVRFVRGNPDYGINDFADNGDGTISDDATGLMWTKADSGQGMPWKSALDYCESNTTGGFSDWKLPNAKELHSILDYAHAPAADGLPAINPIFDISSIRAENGRQDYPYFWTGTTHAREGNRGRAAVYIAFGTAFGYMSMPPWSDNKRLMDVHGAGAQRCDVKSGNPDTLPKGKGPQGDVIRINNYVRCVRNL